jgi:hypothetical protein
MPPPKSKPLPPHSKSSGIAETELQMRNYIESIWRMVRASKRRIEAGREAIARADEMLARRLSDRR